MPLLQKSGVLKAKVFRNGRSQAVRIPAEFRFNSDEVYIERNPANGVITLSEKPLRRSLDEIFKELDEAGAADFELERDLSPPQQRDWM
jgi:antitoxin VapB